MSPPVDLEKGVTVPKPKEEEKEVVRCNHLLVVALDLIPVLILVGVIIAVLSIYRDHGTWSSGLQVALVLLPSVIFMFWKCRQMKKEHIQCTKLVSANGDLSTTLLASTRNKPANK